MCSSVLGPVSRVVQIVLRKMELEERGGSAQVFVRTEDGRTLAIDVPNSKKILIFELLRLVEVCARPLLSFLLRNLKLLGKELRSGMWWCSLAGTNRRGSVREAPCVCRQPAGSRTQCRRLWGLLCVILRLEHTYVRVYTLLPFTSATTTQQCAEVHNSVQISTHVHTQRAKQEHAI